MCVCVCVCVCVCMCGRMEEDEPMLINLVKKYLSDFTRHQHPSPQPNGHTDFHWFSLKGAATNLTAKVCWSSLGKEPCHTHSLFAMQYSVGRSRFLSSPCSTEFTEGRWTSCRLNMWDYGWSGERRWCTINNGISKHCKQHSWAKELPKR